MTGNKIIEIAKKYLGANGEKFCRDYGMSFGNHWCCAFVWDIFRIAKASNLFYAGQKTAYVPTAQMWLAANCEHVSLTKARAGDIVVFTWSGNGYNQERGSRDHIGFIRKAGTSGEVFTIEGNTGGTSPINSRVMERTRSACFVFGIYRPNYKAENAPKKDEKKETSNQSTEKKKSLKSKEKTLTIDRRYKVVSKIGMNVRKKPDKSSKRVGGIGFGKIVRATKMKGDWVFVKYGRLSGWIKRKNGGVVYLQKIK